MEQEALRTGRRKPTHACGVGSRSTKNFFLSAVALLARKESTMWKISDPPMNQYASSPVKPLLDEGIAGVKVLDDIFVFHVIDFDDVVLEIHEEIIVKRQSQHRYDVCDIGLSQSFFAP